MEKSGLSHIDDNNAPAMVNVGEKKVTHRSATARSIVVVSDEILALIEDGDIQSKKGPVFHTAIIAGTMAAKKTGELIPLCHPIGMDGCDIEIKVDHKEIVIRCTCSVTAKTGIEMEALTGASIAALTIYDMCKAMSHDIVIRETRLIAKTGGKKDFHHE
ncbi:cyclic pyranopterin monophosphate synthase MoaC [Reichenbachiella agariperforans]|uniref:cyclic pyranopterin monophosphate synthase MoaC n=1 Tax=Reichenbachiella agariperforans TaxID=156994 RepID=UPI001C09BF97|nr:cyclic pyranopterin monophosphate synthase MoaC [Reichenbachiella agariperforans]MBU2913682.1 cyclic pyranopterin monophosphate synthase MoaC [Reichenbachiella agariperforans]